jgi:nicotinamide-nucleotide amidase
MSDDTLHDLAHQVGLALKSSGLMLVTAESCTGGWISEVITSVAGSSEWFDRGYVTYSNRAKQEMLGVKSETLIQHGAVSEPTVMEMVQGALLAGGADVALAVSGIAGPGGATPDKPVGTICLGWCLLGEQPITETRLLLGNRTAVRRQSVILALQGLLARIRPE